ncbi:YcjF family protein [Leptodesmis sp.]|uniref:YcjF family protein n=1 Tax=Leptodesmis sp. TaxID=3100501 RepID=UPI00405357EC
MTDKLQRPLLVGGLTLAAALWMLEFLHQSFGEWELYTMLALAISAGVWWIQRPSTAKVAEELSLPKYVDVTAVKQALAEVEQVLLRLKLEADDTNSALAGVQPQVSWLQSQVGQIAHELDRETLRLIVMGAKGSGKTVLLRLLQTYWVGQVPQSVSLYEAPSVGVETAGGLDAEALMLKQAIAADLVLFLVTGDLTDSELQQLKRLAARKRTLLVFNKQDLYLPEERQLILNRMQNWGRGFLSGDDVVAIAAAPKPLKVRYYQDDGAVQEWMEEQPPDLAALTQRLTAIVDEESRQLVLASALTQALDLKAQTGATLNEVRRLKAMPVIEKFQWVSAATAFASPVPTLDVVATAAINVQMILDLGAIYQQKFSVDQAQKVVTTLGSLILKLGLVEFSTRTVSHLLKTNAVTYIAGGCIQAVSAAYLTRIAGLTLIEYFHTQEPNLTLSDAKPLSIDRLGEIVQQVFQKNQQISVVQTFILQVLDRIIPKATQPSPSLCTDSAPNASTSSPLPPPLPSPPLVIPLSLPQPEGQVVEQNETKTPIPLAVPLDATQFPSS